MTMPDMATLSSLAMAVALAGCSSDIHGTGKHADPTVDPRSPPSTIDYAPNQAAPKTIGRVITTVAGATLYTFDDDQNGESSCYDDCAKHWPPLIALSTAKAHWRMSLTRRTDGQR